MKENKITWFIVKVPFYEPNLLSNLSQFNYVNFYLFVSWCGLVVNNIWWKFNVKFYRLKSNLHKILEKITKKSENIGFH